MHIFKNKMRWIYFKVIIKTVLFDAHSKYLRTLSVDGKPLNTKGKKGIFSGLSQHMVANK